MMIMPAMLELESRLQFKSVQTLLPGGGFSNICSTFQTISKVSNRIAENENVSYLKYFKGFGQTPNLIVDCEDDG